MKTNCAAVFLASALMVLPAGASENATYAGLVPDRFLTRWLVLAPIPVEGGAAADEPKQQQAFAADLLAAAGGEADIAPTPGLKATVAGKELEWRLVSSPADIVDLDGAKNEFAVAYAWAEIDMPEAARGVFGLGSDDGIKVWVNGVLVHEKWAGRALRVDEDLVGVDLRPGRNRVLLKVQNMRADWAFALRRLGAEQQTRRLIAAAGSGDADAVTLLLDRGATVDGRGAGGLTAVQAAKLHGRQALVDLLVRRGADAGAPLPPRAGLADALLAESFKADGPGAAVLVAKDGAILFEKAYGRRDVEGGVAASADTKFRIGSVTKQFTAAAILELQEQGKLSVRDTLSKFIPDYPRGGEVTIHHLLTHTSGIRSFTSKPDFLATVTEGTTPERHIASFKDDPYDFAPGARFSYNNSGYFLLGYIVEKASGTSYAEYLRKTFFIPLGMRDTGFHDGTGRLANEALGYSFTGGQAARAVDWNMTRAGGAGALYSTVRDLHRWNEALFAGKVLSAASLEAALTPVVTADDDPSQPRDTGYGYGWSIQELRGEREISHGGGLSGFVSYLLRLPDARLTVAVLVNAAPPPPGVDAGALARDIAELYVGDRLAVRETPKLDATVSSAALDAVAGSYDLSGATLTVTREGSRMFTQIAGQPRSEIFPRSETAFFVKGRDGGIAFEKNAKGEVAKAVLTNPSGLKMAAARKEEDKTAKVDPKTYDAYVGRYDYGGAILTVTREGDKLMAQLSGQPVFEIFPKSDTTFFWKVVSAEVTFVKDEKGVITKAIHKQGGQTIDAAKLGEVKETAVDPKLYDAYVGRYDYGQAVMTVTREGDRLLAQMAGQPKFEIFPKSETTFFWKVVNAEITFVKDASGAVTQAVHKQGGQTLEVRRLK